MFSLPPENQKYEIRVEGEPVQFNKIGMFTLNQPAVSTINQPVVRQPAARPNFDINAGVNPRRTKAFLPKTIKDPNYHPFESQVIRDSFRTVDQDDPSADDMMSRDSIKRRFNMSLDYTQETGKLPMMHSNRFDAAKQSQKSPYMIPNTGRLRISTEFKDNSSSLSKKAKMHDLEVAYAGPMVTKTRKNQ